MRLLATALCGALVASSVPAFSAAAPSVQTFQQVLTKRLMELKRDGATERQVLFQSVTPGRPNGNRYPFQANVIIRDYGPGYPANRYYGSTCVGRLEAERFDLLPDDFGGWMVQGRMTPTNTECKDNPAQGASAFPLATLQGTQVSGNAPAAPPAAAPAGRTAASPLHMGEYACYGNGGLLAGMGFKLAANGRYTDVDNERGGTYAYNAGSVTFRGGFLDGQTGRGVTNQGSFDLSATVNCEPWR
jgi:hypothetical protein